MKQWIRITTSLVAVISVILASVAIQAPSVEAQAEPPPTFGIELVDPPTTIYPGGSYDIKVRVTRPSGMVLPAWRPGVDPPKWEIRVYFYEGLSCYNQGEWTEIGGDLLYTGWWVWRFRGDSWTAAMDDTREFTINVKVVEHPRPAEDIERGMNEIPIGGEVRLKVRLRLRGMTYTEGADNFEYYGQTFEVGGLNIEKSPADYWHIDYDKVMTGIGVSEAPAVAFEIPLIAKIGIGIVVIVAIIAAIVVIKKRKVAEIPPPPTPTSI